jgi:hypothetical protein
MRLINTSTLELEEFMGVNVPPYAILSHTWEEEEITFQEMSPKTHQVRNKKGYKKIKKTCEVAKEAGLQYAWVDTCCIDKRSSAELTEAINSMFQWWVTVVNGIYGSLTSQVPEVQSLLRLHA